eukprot:Seg990.3 transcript_id=Seg990.3/GoldUCD/mRNA.D3Y31 product="hypothetical protein" protein_id=Seg990.3/GoldUCD/D3Y31
MDLKLVLSPKKRRKNGGVAENQSLTQERLCVVHNRIYDKESKISVFTESSWKRVKDANIVRKSEEIIRIKRELGVNQVPDQTFGYHRKCYSYFTHKKTLAILRKKHGSEKPEFKRLSGRKRDRHGKVIADQECCICTSKKTAKGGSGHEKLEKCLTEIGATSLKEAAILKKDNPDLLANVVGVNWEVINARELYYHRSCFRSYTRKERKSKQRNDVLAFQSTIEHIEQKVFSERRTVGVPELFDRYQNILENEPSMPSETCDIRTFRSRLLKHFGPNLGEWNSQNSGYVFYDKEIPIEQILEVTKKLHTETKNLKDAPIDERIKDVASELRKEVLDMNDSFSNWPPTEDQLIESETTIPLLLKTFLTALLSKRAQPSSRRQAKIDSIGQDIIYCIKNGKSRTLKHTLLSLCCKRKTGSRQVVKWLNRFGHGISYDEVCVLETSIALQQFWHDW